MDVVSRLWKRWLRLQVYLDTLLMTPEEVKKGLISEAGEDPFGDWKAAPPAPGECAEGVGHTHGEGDGTVCYGDHGGGKRRKTKK